MIIKFKLFENHIYKIGDIVYCINLPFSGFYTNRPYEIIKITIGQDEDGIEGEFFQLKDTTNNKQFPYWILKDRFIPDYEYNANKYNL